VTYRPDLHDCPVPEIQDLWRRWDSKVLYMPQVLGALELAYYRGYQGGFEDCAAGKGARHHVNAAKRSRRKRSNSSAEAP
jgi:hypothetical protein